jgi:hypothetical protein
MDIIKRLNDNELYIDAIDDAIAEIERLRENNAKLVAVCDVAKNLRFEIRSLLCILAADVEHDSLTFSVTRLERIQEYVDKLTSAIADVEDE